MNNQRPVPTTVGTNEDPVAQRETAGQRRKGWVASEPVRSIGCVETDSRAAKNA